jgi:hypothetical protein
MEDFDSVCHLSAVDSGCYEGQMNLDRIHLSAVGSDRKLGKLEVQERSEDCGCSAGHERVVDCDCHRKTSNQLYKEPPSIAVSMMILVGESQETQHWVVHLVKLKLALKGAMQWKAFRAMTLHPMVKMRRHAENYRHWTASFRTHWDSMLSCSWVLWVASLVGWRRCCHGLPLVWPVLVVLA